MSCSVPDPLVPAEVVAPADAVVPGQPPPPHRVEDHFEWVAEMAAKTCRKYHLKDGPDQPDFLDVYQAGVVKLLDRWNWFQPEPGTTDLVGAFRGYAARTILTDCQRQCERLVNGGTYHCRRRTGRHKIKYARPFSALRTPTDEERQFEPSGRGLTMNLRD